MQENPFWLMSSLRVAREGLLQDGGAVGAEAAGVVAHPLDGEDGAHQQARVVAQQAAVEGNADHARAGHVARADDDVVALADEAQHRA